MGLSMGNAISTCFFAFLEVEYDRPSLNTSENFFTCVSESLCYLWEHFPAQQPEGSELKYVEGL